MNADRCAAQCRKAKRQDMRCKGFDGGYIVVELPNQQSNKRALKRAYRQPSTMLKQAYQMVQGFTILFLLLLVGELISRVLGLPVPGSILGLLLLLLSLHIGAIKLEWIKPAAELLLRNLSLFFVPPGVGLMLYFEPLRDYALPLAAAIVLSMLAVMAVVAFVYQHLERKA